jgi:hypothetical protein
LPDIRDRKATYPENDYAKGTQVMALYPDTTSFYSAKIVAGPLHDKGKVGHHALPSFIICDVKAMSKTDQKIFWWWINANRKRTKFITSFSMKMEGRLNPFL